MRYVDGFVIPVPTKNLPAYRKMSRHAGKIWREHGALEYRECVGDDMHIEGTAGFPQTIKVKPGETVVFAWIVYKSRADRNRINAKVMQDPRLNMPKKCPFDVKRMAYGGFKVMVDL